MANAVSCVGPQNIVGYPARHKRLVQVPVYSRCAQPRNALPVGLSVSKTARPRALFQEVEEKDGRVEKEDEDDDVDDEDADMDELSKRVWCICARALTG